MSSFILKVLAYLTMFSDHIGFLFFPETELFVIIGRISFPIFAFLVAEGFTKTSDANKYLKRLFIFGAISQLPFMYFYFLTGESFILLNILFTLSAGLILLILIKKKSWIFLLLSFLVIIFINTIVPFDYDIYGILLVLASYLLIKHRDLGLLSLVLITIFFSLDFNSLENSYLQIYALLAIIPVMMYNRLIGPRVSRWWFYSIYPVHFVILALIFHLL